MDKNMNQLTAEDCQRVEATGEQPQSYDKEECDGCTNWNCPFMPPGAAEKFMQGERDALFPNGEDDGNALDKEGF